MRSIILLMALGLLVGGGSGCGETNQKSAGSEFALDSATLVNDMGVPADQAARLAHETNRYVAEIGVATYRDLLIRLGAEPDPRSISETAAFLVMRGAVRMGEEAIDSVATMRSGWIERFGCEPTINSSASSASRWGLLARLDSTTLADLMDFYTETTLAVINQTGTVPEFDRARLVSAWRAFHARLPLAEQDRFVRFLDNPSPSGEDECWFQRRLWSLLPELPTEDRRVLLWQIATNRF